MEKIFKSTDDVDSLVEQICPPEQKLDSFFKKFGTNAGGLSDCWHYSNNWKELSEIEKWKYVALCERYWRIYYQNYYYT